MSENNKKHTKKTFLLSSIAIGLFLTPFLLYFIILAPLSDFSFAKNDQSWANFGSFIGGTIGPVFSALAFYGVWKTYETQKEQLAEIKRQSVLEELQRLIKDQHQLIDTYTKQTVTLVQPYADPSVLTILEYLTQIHNLKLKITNNNTPSQSNGLQLNLAFFIQDAPKSEIYEIEKILMYTDTIYQEYLKCGGAPQIIKLYLIKHNIIILGMDAVKSNPTLLELINKYL